MIRLSAIPIASALLTHAVAAGEVTVEQSPFSIERSFNATALPDSGAVLLQIEPEAWADYQILAIADHGTRVAKGDVLVKFDAEDIDKKLADSRRALESGTLALAQAELDLKNLQETSPHKLDALRRTAEIAKEENSYFTKTRRKATEESADQELERKKQFLDNQQEELRQLTKMYAADDVTEETEEIILTRQKDDVAAAEFALRMETLGHERTLKVKLPREAVALSNGERDAAIALAKGEEDIPRAVAMKKLEVETMKTAQERAKQDLAKLEKDRTLFEIKAPADGWFYYGAIENGRWSAGEAVKSLVKHGRPAPNRPFATFVPATASLNLTAFLDEATARSLKAGLGGDATLAGREDAEIAVKLETLAAAPGPDGTYRADLAAEWPKDLVPATGSSVQVRVTAYQKDEAIAVPSKAVTHGPKGWSVEIKLADGKTEHRSVKRGRVSGDNTEILSGLEAGQVIITPDK